MTKSRYRDVDQGWAWVVMMAAFGSQFISGMFCYGAGVIHVALIQEFGGDIAFTSLIGALYASLLCLEGPFVSMMVNRWSCRTATSLGGFLLFIGMSTSFFVEKSYGLLITYGIISGTGLSFAAIPSVIVVGYSFDKYRGIAVGFCVAGAGAGMFASGPFIQFLIDFYGIRGAYLMFGAVASNIILLGALMRPSELELTFKSKVRVKVLPSDRIDKKGFFSCIDVTVFKNKTFVLIMLSFAVWNIPYATVLIHLPFYSVTQGFTNAQAAVLVTMVGLGSTINRFLTGIALGPNGIDPLLLFTGFLGVAGVLTVTFPFYSSIYAGQMFYSFAVGIYTGGLNCLINPLAVELVGVEQLSLSVGMIFFVCGIGYLIGPVVAGLIVDNGGTYETGFYISGVCFIISCLIAMLSSIWRNKGKDQMNESKLELNETRFLSGSAYLSKSLNIVYDEQQMLRNSMTSIASHEISIKVSMNSLLVSKQNTFDSQDSLSDRKSIVLKNLDNRSKSLQRLRTYSEDKNGHIPEKIPLRCQDITER